MEGKSDFKCYSEVVVEVNVRELACLDLFTAAPSSQKKLRRLPRPLSTIFLEKGAALKRPDSNLREFFEAI